MLSTSPWSLPSLSRVGIREVSASAHSAAGPIFALGFFSASHAWLLMVRQLEADSSALFSYSLEQLLLWSCFLFVDDRLTRRSSRFLWSALATVAVSCILFDGLLLRMTSLNLGEILPMLLASQHVIEGLREIGLRPDRLAVLLVVLLLAASSGGLLRLWLGDLCAKRAFARPKRALVSLLALLSLAFGVEQTLARDTPNYLYRGFHMPMYAQLYATSSHSVIVPLPPPAPHTERARWLQHVGHAEHPHHVLYILLESFRADAVEPKVSPAIWQLTRESQYFDHALAEATYTPLSWSVLLFDEAAHDNLYGRFSGRDEALGSWLLNVMHKAGYDLHVSVSTNLTYGKTRKRLLAQNAPPLDFYQAAADEGDEPADKNKNDRDAVDHLAQFIAQHPWDEQPQFMLLQLDSTHYTYPFPEDEAVFEPYSEKLAMPRPLESAHDAELLHNRYRNAAHYVDTQIGRMLDALRSAGIYDDTVVVLTADHGEGLTEGLQGHGAVEEVTKRVPLLFKLPGRAPQQFSHLCSHRDILPTLADYLGITLPPTAARGRNAFTPARAVLTLAPSGNFGQITMADAEIDVGLRYTPTTVTVTPVHVRSLLTKDSNQTLATASWLGPLTNFMQNGPALVTDVNAARATGARTLSALH